ncbi:MAG: hypothetical protein KC547_12370 [Anaerolineae bacterium]|nr:hypothetical protein [Anaerolineae bacterium]MCA9911654.1 hypothetical protein [Anaerolineae bacterium]
MEDLSDLKARVKSLLNEIEYTHLKKAWVERIIDAGIDKRDTGQWVVEIGHIMDEYDGNLRFLIDLLEQTEVEKIARQLESWVAYTHDITAWKIDSAMNELETNGGYHKYLPPEPDDADDDTEQSSS